MMNKSRRGSVLVIIALLYLSSPISVQTQDSPIDSLLEQMTLEEKIGQMTQIAINKILTDSIAENYGSATKFELDTGKVIHYVKDFHVGSFLNGRAVPPENWYRVTNTLQRINAEYSAIPLLYGIDHVHGSSYLKGGTVFPHNMNLANTFDSQYAYHAGRTASVETADLGHNWNFSPVLGIGRSKSWGRFYETYGEDPLVVSRMGAAEVRGIQDSGATAPFQVASTAKHFLGYSDPKSGWDRSPAEIPDQILREFFLPPFRAAIQAGVKTIMLNSGEINGIPVHASREIVTHLLREELGFTGVVITDWKDIIALEEMHRVAKNHKEATFLAVQAGIDVAMTPFRTDFCTDLAELVREGRITEERIDRSVRRILQLKIDLGLFENPYPGLDRVENRVGRPENREYALQAARESIVLMKNQRKVLPLDDPGTILLTGPNADRKEPLCGGWTYRFMPTSEHWFPEMMPTVFEAMRDQFPDADIRLVQEQEFDAAAEEADAIVIAAGEPRAYAETEGTIDDLHLADNQIRLIHQAVETGKPVILLLIEGRPRLIPEVYDSCDAVLFVGLPGPQGATALAEILSGAVNPSGKLSFTYPYRSGHIIPYNHKHSEYSPLRPVSQALHRYAIGQFGHGLSYTTFRYHDLKMDTLLAGPEDSLTCQVTVTNTGDRAGKEAVLWYISDEFASITRPVKELQHFDKMSIEPGQSETFTFTIHPEKHLAFPDAEGVQQLESGMFTVSVGDLKSRFRYMKNAK